MPAGLDEICIIRLGQVVAPRFGLIQQCLGYYVIPESLGRGWLHRCRVQLSVQEGHEILQVRRQPMRVKVPEAGVKPRL